MNLEQVIETLNNATAAFIVTVDADMNYSALLVSDNKEKATHDIAVALDAVLDNEAIDESAPQVLSRWIGLHNPQMN